MALEAQVENPTEERVRIVEGRDLTPLEFQSKLEEVSELLVLNLTVCIAIWEKYG